MSNLSPNGPKNKPSVWLLIIGVISITNFFIECWVLLPPFETRIIFFWFVKFYDGFQLPSLLLLPIGIFLIALWIIGLTSRQWEKAIGFLIGAAIASASFILAFGWIVFVSNLSVIGDVEQNGQIYYLIKYYDDDLAPNYYFCESGPLGFSGRCIYIGWKGGDEDPTISVNPSTNLINVVSEKPSFIWVNSDPPKCTNFLNEDPDMEFVGGCSH